MEYRNAPKTTVHAASRGRAVADWLLLIAPGLIWGASFLFIAEGLEALEPNGITFTRILIGFVTLGLFPAARRPIAGGDGRAIAPRHSGFYVMPSPGLSSNAPFTSMAL